MITNHVTALCEASAIPRATTYVAPDASTRCHPCDQSLFGARKQMVDRKGSAASIATSGGSTATRRSASFEESIG